MLPRIDVSTSALVAAITGLLLMGFNYFVLGVALGPVAMAALPVLAVTAVVGIVAYLVPVFKELFAGIAGALVVIAEAYLTSRHGGIIDVGSVSAALTYLVQLFVLLVLPRLRAVPNPTTRSGYSLEQDTK